MNITENVTDIRNSRVIGIISELKEYGVEVITCDPLADKAAVKLEYNIELTEYSRNIKVDAVVIVVAHNIFKKELTSDILKGHMINNDTRGAVVDVKGLFDRSMFSDSHLLYWRL